MTLDDAKRSLMCHAIRYTGALWLWHYLCGYDYDYVSGDDDHVDDDWSLLAFEQFSGVIVPKWGCECQLPPTD